MFKFIKGLFSKGSTSNFPDEAKPNSTLPEEVRPNNKKKMSWKDISDMKIPSSEKIKLVVIQENPFSDGETIEAKRKYKRYFVTVIPQAKDHYEYDDSKKITVQVLAGSKIEAMDTLSDKLSGKKYFFSDSTSNTAIVGRWYDGNMYSLEITSFEKAERKIQDIL